MPVELFVARAAGATGDVEELAAREVDDVVVAGYCDGAPGAARVEDPGEQRPSAAHLRFLADEAPALLQPRLQDTRLVGPTSGGRYTLMDEDQLSLGVDVLPAEREKLLGSHAGEERREDKRPVPRRNRVEEAAGLLGWDPAAFGARASGLEASVGEIYARAERWVDFDAVLTECVAEDRRQAADRAVYGGLRETALQQGALDVVQVPSGDLGAARA